MPKRTAFADFSRRLARAATAVFALIAALMLVVAAILAQRLTGIGTRRLALAAFVAAPVLFHLWALWSLRTLFVSLADHGLAFHEAPIAAVARTGWGLLLGGGMTLAATPFILALAPPASAGGFAVATLPALTLCLVGLALIALTALFREGLAVQSEREALRSTLDEFV